MAIGDRILGRIRRSAGNMRYARGAAQRLGKAELMLAAAAAVISLPLACTLAAAGAAMLGIGGGMGWGARLAGRTRVPQHIYRGMGVTRQRTMSRVSSYHRASRAPRSATRSLAVRRAKDGDGGDADGPGSGDSDSDLVFPSFILFPTQKHLINRIISPHPCHQHGCCCAGGWAA
jgi:hypothetical protein